MKTCTVAGSDYVVLRLLGKGKGGYTYLAQNGDGDFVALKQIHHEPCDYYTFGDKLEAELRDYGRLMDIGIRMPRLLAHDQDSERLVKEFIPGPTVFDLVREDALPCACLEQMQQMCDLLYAHQTNIDYFPTNFILSDGLLYYVDYECNPYMEQWDFAHWGKKYWSKTPEFLAYVADHCHHPASDSNP